MFAKKVIILKSDLKELFNSVCRIEKNTHRYRFILGNNLSNLEIKENIFCLILDKQNRYAISRLMLEENYLTCSFEGDFDLNEISIFICEFENNTISILAIGSQSRLNQFEQLMARERANILNSIYSQINYTRKESNENLCLNQNDNNITTTSTTLENIENESEFALPILEKSTQEIELKNSSKKYCDTHITTTNDSYLRADENLNCDNCFYKKEYIRLTSQQESEPPYKENPVDSVDSNCINDSINILQSKKDDEICKEVKEEKKDFYQQVEKSIQYLFETKQEDNLLQSFIEDSKFVKVEYEETKDFYSVGIIYENEEPKYICYALPCEEGSPPPENLAKFAQFLPIGNHKGYYLMYQDAKTGENIVIQSI